MGRSFFEELNEALEILGNDAAKLFGDVVAHISEQMAPSKSFLRIPQSTDPLEVKRQDSPPKLQPVEKVSETTEPAIAPKPQPTTVTKRTAYTRIEVEFSDGKKEVSELKIDESDETFKAKN